MKKLIVTQQEMLRIGEDFEEYRHRIVEMLSTFQNMWSRCLGQVHLAKHRISLSFEAKPVYQLQIKAGPNVRDFELKEVQRMLEEGVIEPSVVQWILNWFLMVGT